jgi:phosphoribosylformylglycinamidine synthase
VSFYNETSGQGILPTPAIGGVGVLDDIARMATIGFKAPDEAIVLIGGPGSHLGASLYLREILGREDGAAPAVDLAAERRNGDFVRRLIGAGEVSACHDVSDGGLLVAVAEMAMAGGIGAQVAVPGPYANAPHAWLFGEDQGRYILTVAAAQADSVLAAAARAGVPATRIGTTGGDALKLAGGPTISDAAVRVSALRRLNEAWLPAYMNG